MRLCEGLAASKEADQAISLKIAPDIGEPK